MKGGSDKELYAAVHRLKATSEFQILLRKLESDLAETDRSGRKLEGNEMYRNQGKALYLESLLALAANTNDVLRKFNQQNP